MDTATDGSFWGSLSDRFFKVLDYSIDDAFGQIQPLNPTGDVWGTWAPERTAPKDEPPVVPGFQIGNNTQTWGIGFALLVGSFLLYKAVK